MDDLGFKLTQVKNRLNILNKLLIADKYKKNEFITPRANILIQECVNHQDVDGDGKIYGYDFLIEENKDIPQVLLIFQKQFKNKQHNMEYISWE